MKTWNQLFVRHGWLLEERKENVFDGHQETPANIEFLLKTLNQLEIAYEWTGDHLHMIDTPVSEFCWLEALEFRFRGRAGNVWFKPGQEQPRISDLDTYISGVVRQLNRLGFYTTHSCDGHGRRQPSIGILPDINPSTLATLLDAVYTERYRIETDTHAHTIRFQNLSRSSLLNLAEKLHNIPEPCSHMTVEELDQYMFAKQVEMLLSVPGESGNEAQIRQVVMEKLKPFVDHITIDSYGNILAEKTYRHGYGPIILLSAHLDVYDEIVQGRKIIKDGDTWRSSEGILGADDRAGVAVLLHVARELAKSTFCGKVKFVFSVEEEIGLIGASNVSHHFLWGTDAAVVVDRRGTGDIVTSCGGFLPFCHEAYGHFFETIALEKELPGWNCVSGGSSDTRIWAEHGIQSVNLSAGYSHEHTDHETLDIRACFNVTKLILGVFENERKLVRLLRSIDRVRVK